jgi:hypothetical protein
MIINLNYFFLVKRLDYVYIIFTFATMKNNQKQENYSSYENRNNRSFKNIETHSIKNIFVLIFSSFKIRSRKLQIIYANIRV